MKTYLVTNFEHLPGFDGSIIDSKEIQAHSGKDALIDFLDNTGVGIQNIKVERSDGKKVWTLQEGTVETGYNLFTAVEVE